MSNEVHFTLHSPKREAFAHLLNLIFPGVGLAYWRRDSRGFLWCSVTLVTCMVSITAWLLSPIIPQLFLSLLAAGWLCVEWIVFDEVRGSRPDQLTWRRHAQGLISYLGGASLCLISLALIFYVTFTRAYGLVYVQHNAMFPQILSGDVVLIDRRSGPISDLKEGQLIAYQSQMYGVTIARVIASRKGARVEVSGHEVSIDGEALTLSPQRVEMTHLIDNDRQMLRASEFFIERDSRAPQGGGERLIARATRSTHPLFKLSTSLTESTLLVLPDVRYAHDGGAMITGELIERTRLLGVPVMIVSSQYPHLEASSRRGIRTR